MLVFSFSSKLHLGSYMASIDKFAFKIIGALIRSEIALYFKSPIVSHLNE